MPQCCRLPLTASTSWIKGGTNNAKSTHLHADTSWDLSLPLQQDLFTVKKSTQNFILCYHAATDRVSPACLQNPRHLAGQFTVVLSFAVIFSACITHNAMHSDFPMAQAETGPFTASLMMRMMPPTMVMMVVVVGMIKGESLGLLILYKKYKNCESILTQNFTWLCSPLVMRKAARVATAAVTSTTKAPILMMILFFCSRDFRAAIRAGGSALGSGSNPPLPFPVNKCLLFNQQV